jgi:hypothetical protein
MRFVITYKAKRNLTTTPINANWQATWNFKHLANATMRYKIEKACRQSGYEPPIMELLEE